MLPFALEDVTVKVGNLEDGFYVEDDGPGIPPAEHDWIFEQGYSTEEDGPGFGLAIVRAHDWTSTVTEGPDGGERFEVTGIASSNR